jgi:hypothetical protein
MPPTNQTLARYMVPIIAGLSCTITALSIVNGITEMTEMRPHIGDIVSFTPHPDQSTPDAARLIVHRTNRSGCILDVTVLHRVGGSLMVERQTDSALGSYNVHWAGERTSNDNGNCGTSADLLLDSQELDTLAFSAGGYGAVQKRLPTFVSLGGS